MSTQVRQPRELYFLSSSTSFGALGVPASLTQVLAARDIITPTPIQAATLADAIAGRDVLGRGRTGSGKTYAFLLPLVTRLAAAPTKARPRQPRAVILAPTRELATQIDTALQPLAAVAGLRSRTVFGGVGQQPQAKALQAGVDVLVACPGRLEDLVEQGLCRLDAVEITVLDEADHMADLGFLPGVTRLLAQTPRSGQRMFFSATLDSGVDGLVKRFLQRPAVHQADSAQAPVAAMAHHVLHVRSTVRTDVLVDLAAAPGRTVIFTRTKHRAKSLTRQLNARGVPAVELHGNLSQNARTRSMDAFHAGRVENSGRHRHRRPRHPRRRRRARGARRPAGRAQGLRAPLRPYGARRQAGHRRHRDDRRPGRRRPGADSRGRHPTDHHRGGQRSASGAPAARRRRAPVRGGADRRSRSWPGRSGRVGRAFSIGRWRSRWATAPVDAAAGPDRGAAAGAPSPRPARHRPRTPRPARHLQQLGRRRAATPEPEGTARATSAGAFAPAEPRPGRSAR